MNVRKLAAALLGGVLVAGIAAPATAARPAGTADGVTCKMGGGVPTVDPVTGFKTRAAVCSDGSVVLYQYNPETHEWVQVPVSN